MSIIHIKDGYILDEMKKALLIILGIVFALVLFGCPDDGGVTCNRPYLKVGTSCCLDFNDNRVCDIDEGEIKCDPPRIKTDFGCCLDLNDNGICDIDDGDCERPFAMFDGECLLDGNNNGIPDADECDPPEVLRDDECCIDDDLNGYCDKYQLGPGEVQCPAELLAKEYSFFEATVGGVWFKNMIVDDDLHREDRKCIRCEFGSEAGQNINLKYCDEFLWGPVADVSGNVLYDQIYVDVVLKEKGREKTEGLPSTGGTFMQGACESIPKVEGTWV